MTTLAHSSPASGPMGWFTRAEKWLDDRGKPAWITAMILGFIFVWPVGLALLFYMLWSKKMSCNTAKWRGNGRTHMSRGTGNTAFDAYRDETLRRLQEEQDGFESFLDRLRKAKDKSEFDQYMDEREKAAASDPETREA